MGFIKKFFNSSFSFGIANIAVMVAVSLTLTAIIVTVQAITLLNVRMARNSISEKSTFYAAEGIVYDTLARMNASYDSATGTYGWPDSADLNNPVTLSSMEGIDILRTIRLNGLKYEIDITASTPRSSRRLVASLLASSGGFVNTDIILIVDRSGSMAFEGARVCDMTRCAGETKDWSDKNLNCSLFGNCQKISQPIYSAKSAAQYFVDLLRQDAVTAPPNTYQSGYIWFQTTADVQKKLDTDHDATYNSLKTISVGGWTNIYQSLSLAKDQFDTYGRVNAKKAIVLLTDGLPNMFDVSNYPDCSIPNTPTTDTTYTNSDCVQQAFAMANTLKNNGVIIYTIGLGLAEPHDDLTQDQITFAHYFLDNIANSPPNQYAYYVNSWTDWTSASTLHDVYAGILEHILSTPYLTIEEKPAE